MTITNNSYVGIKRDAARKNTLGCEKLRYVEHVYKRDATQHLNKT